MQQLKSLFPSGPSSTGMDAKSTEDAFAVEASEQYETTDIFALEFNAWNGSDLSDLSSTFGCNPPSLELSSSNDISSSINDSFWIRDRMPPPSRDPPSCANSSLLRINRMSCLVVLLSIPPVLRLWRYYCCIVAVRGESNLTEDLPSWKLAYASLES